MSINIDQVEDVEQAIADKAEYLMGQVECMLYKARSWTARTHGLRRRRPLLYSCIQDCIPKVYGRYLDTHRAEDVPVLAQLADELGDMKSPSRATPPRRSALHDHYGSRRSVQPARRISLRRR